MNDYTQVSEFIDILSKAENTNSRNEKISFLESKKNNIFLKQSSRFVFNNLLTLGVTSDFLKETDFDSKPESNYHTTFLNDSEIYLAFNSLVENLSRRLVTGYAARELVLDFLRSLPDDSYRHWYKLFIDKKFVTGMSVGSISKIYPQLKAQCDVQTAETWTPEMEIDFENECWVAEAKIDGMRMSIIKSPSDIPVFLSRDSRPLPEENLKFLLPISEQALNEGFILDGELFAGNWNSTLSITKSHQLHPESEKLKFYVFDCVSQVDFLKGKSDVILEERKNNLRRVLKSNPKIVIVQEKRINSKEHLQELLKESIDSGFEGLVIKNLNSNYEGKRKLSWLKVKPFFTQDFPICNVVAGAGKYLGKPSLEQCKKAVEELKLEETAEDLFSQVSSFLGSFQVESLEGKLCNVGSGFSDSQRIYYSYLHQTQSLIGRLCEVEFQEKTKDGSLRFPVFFRLREDRAKV